MVSAAKEAADNKQQTTAQLSLIMQPGGGKEAADGMLCCASCGKVEGDKIKNDAIILKLCTACKLVRYCSVDCQKKHRPQHKKACKKRMAEIRDANLFRQPDESHLGECPICCLPLPLENGKSVITSCCCKVICKGCDYANYLREEEQGLEERCPFCREPLPCTDEEKVQNLMERVKANDPVGLFQVGTRCHREGDFEGAVEYYTKAAELGEIDAQYKLATMYDGGLGVDKDEKKEVYYLEEAAIRGHPDARYNLGCHEEENTRIDRAVKHFIIAAKLGDDGALERVKNGFQRGWVSKEDYAAALRGHQAAVDATKSKQRDAAYEYFQQFPN
jgi:TPR repeat protein